MCLEPKNIFDETERERPLMRGGTPPGPLRSTGVVDFFLRFACSPRVDALEKNSTRFAHLRAEAPKSWTGAARPCGLSNTCVCVRGGSKKKKLKGCFLAACVRNCERQDGTWITHKNKLWSAGDWHGVNRLTIGYIESLNLPATYTYVYAYNNIVHDRSQRRTAHACAAT